MLRIELTEGLEISTEDKWDWKSTPENDEFAKGLISHLAFRLEQLPSYADWQADALEIVREFCPNAKIIEGFNYDSEMIY